MSVETDGAVGLEITEQTASAGSTAATVSPAVRVARATGGLGYRLITILIWLIVITVVIFSALMASAWIAGFRFENGFPNALGMIDWVLANYNTSN